MKPTPFSSSMTPEEINLRLVGISDSIFTMLKRSNIIFYVDPYEGDGTITSIIFDRSSGKGLTDAAFNALKNDINALLAVYNAACSEHGVYDKANYITQDGIKYYIVTHKLKKVVEAKVVEPSN